MGHLPQGGDGSVGGIVSQERQFLLVGKFYLYGDISGPFVCRPVAWIEPKLVMCGEIIVYEEGKVRNRKGKNGKKGE
jgi:hypothetical protein